MKDRPQVLYKYLDAAGARVFLKEPQMRWKDFRLLDDLMEVLPGYRSLTEREVQALAQTQSNRTGISVDKCAHYYRTLSEMDPTYWEKELRRLIEEQKPTMFICSMSARADSGAMWGLSGATVPPPPPTQEDEDFLPDPTDNNEPARKSA